MASIVIALPLPDVNLANTGAATNYALANRYTDSSVSSLVRFTTNSGPMDIALFGPVAPLSVANFLAYVNSNKYNNTIFHREQVAARDGIGILQGGSFITPAANYTTFPASPAASPTQIVVNPAIALENPTGNTRGTIAMARTGVLNSATSSFFFNNTDNPVLDDPTPAVPDGGYAVFGKLLPASLATLDALSAYIDTDFSQDFPAAIAGNFFNLPLRKAPNGFGFVDFPIAPSDYLIVQNAVVVPGRVGDLSVTSSVPTLVTASISGTTLTLTPVAGQSGFSDIAVTAVGHDGVAVTDTFRVTYASCGIADIGQQGGLVGPDGRLDNNDFVIFVNLFFQSDLRVDFGRQGGLSGSDGLFDNNDFVVYVNAFFAAAGVNGC